MAELLDLLGREMGPLEDLHSKPNKKSVVTLRGQRLGTDGLYLGCMRDSFPGTDGLDRASSPTGEEWLLLGAHQEFQFIVSEGSTLATRRFLTALNAETDLLLLCLHAEDFIKDLRFQARGSTQAESFVKLSATRATNLAHDMWRLGVKVRDVDTADPAEWENALEVSQTFLQKP